MSARKLSGSGIAQLVTRSGWDNTPIAQGHPTTEANPHPALVLIQVCTRPVAVAYLVWSTHLLSARRKGRRLIFSTLNRPGSCLKSEDQGERPSISAILIAEDGPASSGLDRPMF